MLSPQNLSSFLKEEPGSRPTRIRTISFAPTVASKSSDAPKQGEDELSSQYQLICRTFADNGAFYDIRINQYMVNFLLSEWFLGARGTMLLEDEYVAALKGVEEARDTLSGMKHKTIEEIILENEHLLEAKDKREGKEAILEDEYFIAQEREKKGLNAASRKKYETIEAMIKKLAQWIESQNNIEKSTSDKRMIVLKNITKEHSIFHSKSSDIEKKIKNLEDYNETIQALEGIKPETCATFSCFTDAIKTLYQWDRKIEKSYQKDDSERKALSTCELEFLLSRYFSCSQDKEGRQEIYNYLQLRMQIEYKKPKPDLPNDEKALSQKIETWLNASTDPLDRVFIAKKHSKEVKTINKSFALNFIKVFLNLRKWMLTQKLHIDIPKGSTEPAVYMGRLSKSACLFSLDSTTRPELNPNIVDAKGTLQGTLVMATPLSETQPLTYEALGVIRNTATDKALYCCNAPLKGIRGF